MTQEEKIREIFTHLSGLFKLHGFSLKFMRRVVDGQGRGVLDLKKGYKLAYINLKTRTITIDIYTPKFRRPKAVNAILRILAHEIAHFQKMPYRQLYRGKMIMRQHYPAFYKQVNKNIKKMKKDKILRGYFRG